MKKQTKRHSRFTTVMSVVGLFLAIAVVTYGFLSLVNWSLNLQEWTGFSRFILAAIGLAFIIRIFDEI
jgi:hypothetical protein